MRTLAKQTNIQLISGSLLTIISIIRVPILARLILPEDFGLFSVISALIGIFLLFGDAGLSVAAVQKEKFNNNDSRAFNFMTIALGVIMFFIINTYNFFTQYVQNYQQILLLLLSLNFVFFSLGSISLAVLKRNLKFEVISKITIISSIISSIVGIYLAILDFGILALIIMQLLDSLICSISYIYNSKNFNLGFFNLNKPLINSIRFSISLNFSSLLNRISKSLDIIFLKSIVDLNTIGVYSRSKTLTDTLGTQFRNPISNVTFSFLNTCRNDQISSSMIFYKSFSKLLFIHATISFMLLFFSKNIVYTYLGEVWMNAAIPLKLFAPFIFFVAVVGLFDQLYLSHGMLKIYNRIVVFRNVIRIFLLWILILNMGINGAALAWSLGEGIIVIFTILVGIKKLHFLNLILTIKIVLITLFIPAFVCLSCYYLFSILSIPDDMSWSLAKIFIVSILTIFLGFLFQRISNDFQHFLDIDLLTILRIKK